MSENSVLVTISVRYLNRVDELKAQVTGLSQWVPCFQELRAEYISLLGFGDSSHYTREQIDRFLVDAAYSVNVYKTPQPVAAWDLADAIDRIS